MIPIIENIVKSCDTKDTLSELGFLAGSIIASYGLYTYIKDTANPQNISEVISATSTGGIFMIASYIVGNINNESCNLYRY